MGDYIKSLFEINEDRGNHFAIGNRALDFLVMFNSIIDLVERPVQNPHCFWESLSRKNSSSTLLEAFKGQ